MVKVIHQIALKQKLEFVIRVIRQSNKTPMDNRNIKNLFTYDEVRHFIIESLFRATLHFEEKNFLEVGEGYDVLDRKLPRNDLPEFKKLHTALIFWDSWIYVSEHIYSYSINDTDFGVPIKDYPNLARHIISDLQADQDISDPLIIKNFTPHPRSRKSLQNYFVVFHKHLRRLFRRAKDSINTAPFQISTTI